MLDTYKSDSHATAIRQVEVSNYAVLAELTILGWEIELASSHGKPLILFRAAEYEGRQPRFAVTAADAAEFRQVLLDLTKLPVRKRDQMATLGYDEPVWISGGLMAISKQDPDALKMWVTLTGSD